MKKEYRVTISGDYTNENYSKEHTLELISESKPLQLYQANNDYQDITKDVETIELTEVITVEQKKEIENIFNKYGEFSGIDDFLDDIKFDKKNGIYLDYSIVENYYKGVLIRDDEEKLMEELESYLMDNKIVFRDTLNATGYSQGEWQEIEAISAKKLPEHTQEVFSKYLTESCVYVHVSLYKERKDGFSKEEEIDGIEIIIYGTESIEEIWKEALEHFNIDDKIKIVLPENIKYN